MPKDRNIAKMPKRSARGFHSAAATARRTIESVAGKHGFAEANVLLNWDEIAGAVLATRCRPVKVSYGSSRGLGATLVVQTDSARAPEVEHLAHRIIERVNQFYGYRAISRLKVTQSTGLHVGAGLAEERTGFQGRTDAPTDADTTSAAALAQEIESPGLRAALTQMGAYVLAQDRAGGPAKTRHQDTTAEGSDHDR